MPAPDDHATDHADRSSPAPPASRARAASREPFTRAAPAVRDLAAFETDLRAAAAGGAGVSLAEAGRVCEEGFDSPIWVVRVDRPDATKRALVVAGIHGNEPAGAAWAVELVRLLANDPSAFPEVSFDIVPLLNPWGWSRDVRYDLDGRDINRDFATIRLAGSPDLP